MKKKEFFGILYGAVYGIIFKIINIDMDISDLNGIIFLLVVPIILSLVPIYYSSTKNYVSKIKLFFYPFITVATVFATMASDLKTLLFVLIVGIPFFFIAGIIGILVGGLMNENSPISDDEM